MTYRARLSDIILFLMLFATGSSAASLRVVTELSPPNQVLIQNTVTGTSTELVRMILKEAALEADISMYPWARAYKLASTSPDTLIYSIARTPDREHLFHWIGPVAYYQLGFAKLGSREDIQLRNVDDAKSLRIAAQRDDLAAKILTEKGFQVVLTSDIKKSYHLLVAGKVDLIVDDPQFIQDMTRRIGLEDGTVSFIMPIPDLSVYGFLAANINTDESYLNSLKSAFDKVKETKQYNQVLHFYSAKFKD